MLSLSINSYRATQELNTSSTNISARLAGAKKTSTGNDDAAGLEISNRLSAQLGTRATISAEGMALSEAEDVKTASPILQQSQQWVLGASTVDSQKVVIQSQKELELSVALPLQESEQVITEENVYVLKMREGKSAGQLLSDQINKERQENWLKRVEEEAAARPIEVILAEANSQPQGVLSLLR